MALPRPVAVCWSLLLMFDPLLVACRLEQPRDRMILVGQLDKSRTAEVGGREGGAPASLVWLTSRLAEQAGRCVAGCVERVTGVGFLGSWRSGNSGLLRCTAGRTVTVANQAGLDEIGLGAR